MKLLKTYNVIPTRKVTKSIKTTVKLSGGREIEINNEPYISMKRLPMKNFNK